MRARMSGLEAGSGAHGMGDTTGRQRVLGDDPVVQGDETILGEVAETAHRPTESRGQNQDAGCHFGVFRITYARDAVDGKMTTISAGWACRLTRTSKFQCCCWRDCLRLIKQLGHDKVQGEIIRPRQI